MPLPEYDIDLVWDAEARVWVATSENLTGLVIESGSLDALIERVRFTAPELLELNGMPSGNFSLRFHSPQMAS